MNRDLVPVFLAFNRIRLKKHFIGKQNAAVTSFGKPEWQPNKAGQLFPHPMGEGTCEHVMASPETMSGWAGQVSTCVRVVLWLLLTAFPLPTLCPLDHELPEGQVWVFPLSPEAWNQQGRLSLYNRYGMDTHFSTSMATILAWPASASLWMEC